MQCVRVHENALTPRSKIISIAIKYDNGWMAAAAKAKTWSLTSTPIAATSPNSHSIGYRAQLSNKSISMRLVFECDPGIDFIHVYPPHRCVLEPQGSA
jgi:hypothetical protein